MPEKEITESFLKNIKEQSFNIPNAHREYDPEEVANLVESFLSLSIPKNLTLLEFQSQIGSLQKALNDLLDLMKIPEPQKQEFFSQIYSRGKKNFEDTCTAIGES